MINEQEIADSMALLESNPESPLRFMAQEIKELGGTALALWKVARAARRWQLALPGEPSVNAEAQMVEALDALKVE